MLGCSICTLILPCLTYWIVNTIKIFSYFVMHISQQTFNCIWAPAVWVKHTNRFNTYTFAFSDCWENISSYTAGLGKKDNVH